MEIIQVALGSTRRPKINALWEALTVFTPALNSDAQFEVVDIEVPSGVPHTPLSRAEIMKGARNRAEALQTMAQSLSRPWRYFVGMEGGVDVISEAGQRLAFLQNWAFVTDGRRGSFGQSGSLLLPESLAKTVVDEGVELAEAIDAFAGGKGIRNEQGSWGVLTRNYITRQDAFRIAVINAFAPFFSAELYSRE